MKINILLAPWLFFFLIIPSQAQTSKQITLFNQITEMILDAETWNSEDFELVSKSPTKLKLEIKHKGYHGITNAEFHDYYTLSFNQLIKVEADDDDIYLFFKKKYTVNRIFSNTRFKNEKAKEKKLNLAYSNEMKAGKLDKLIKEFMSLQ